MEPCSVCQAQSMTGACQAQNAACQSDSTCQGLQGCLNQCQTGDSACVGLCRGNFSEGTGAYDAIQTCVCQQACVTSCQKVCGAGGAGGAAGGAGG
jgi:hypothetical protein